MQLNEIFAKDIQRPIEGVIKADDAAHLGTEVEEYVLTNEAAKGLELLLEAYTNYTNANGVWISGFFGSGKSHLLKMLAHLLGDVEGQDFDRAKVSESFRAKATGAFLPALLDQGRAHPGQEPAVQHRPEGHPDQQGPDRRPAEGVRQGLRREPRLLRQPGPRRPLRARPRQPRPVRGVQGGVRADRRHPVDPGPRAERAGRRRASTAPSPRSTARAADGIIKQYQRLVRGLDRGLRRRGQGVARQAARRLPPQLLRRRGRPVHRLQHPPDAQPPDDRREPQHQVRAAARGCS